MAAWAGRLLHHLIPVGVTAVVVLLAVVGIHMATLSQQADAAYLYGAPNGRMTTQTPGRDDLPPGLLASGMLCPIHSLGLFGTGGGGPPGR